MINPNMPEEYQNESDYRNIPREHLNPRIPQGRGIVKWNAFKTLTQQYEMLDQYIEDQNKIDMPLLSQEQLEDINNLVNCKIENKSISEVSYWINGYISSIKCFIKTVDEVNGVMLVLKESNYNRLKIPTNSIVNVE